MYKEFYQNVINFANNQWSENCFCSILQVCRISHQQHGPVLDLGQETFFDFCCCLFADFAEFVWNCLFLDDRKGALVHVDELFVWFKELQETIMSWHSVAYADYHFRLGWGANEILVDQLFEKVWVPQGARIDCLWILNLGWSLILKSQLLDVVLRLYEFEESCLVGRQFGG